MLLLYIKKSKHELFDNIDKSWKVDPSLMLTTAIAHHFPKAVGLNTKLIFNLIYNSFVYHAYVHTDGNEDIAEFLRFHIDDFGKFPFGVNSKTFTDLYKKLAFFISNKSGNMTRLIKLAHKYENFLKSTYAVPEVKNKVEYADLLITQSDNFNNELIKLIELSSDNEIKHLAKIRELTEKVVGLNMENAEMKKIISKQNEFIESFKKSPAYPIYKIFK